MQYLSCAQLCAMYGINWKLSEAEKDVSGNLLFANKLIE